MAAAGSERGPTPEAARAIARAAYIFLYPLVVNYGAAYEMAIDPQAAGDFGRWRRRRTVARKPGRAREVVRQVSCTWLDLGPQPMLLLAPPHGWGGCVTQSFDLWGFTPEVSGVEPQRRATGAPFLISAFPQDAACAGTDAEVRSETRLMSVCCTQYLPPPSSRPLRAGMVEDPVVMPLSSYLGFDAPPPWPTNWFRWHEAVLTGPDFWGCAAFALSLARPHPDDLAILGRLREIGVVAGVDRDPGTFDEAVTWAIDLGMYQAIEELVRTAGGVRVGRSWPTRRQVDRDYFARAVRALAGPHLGRTRRGLGLVFDGQ